MFDMIREWPRYVKVPLPIAKVSMRIFFPPLLEGIEFCLLKVDVKILVGINGCM